MKTLLKGNIALVEGAVAGGLDAYFGYPITPQNEIPEYMSLRMPQEGRVFLQAESEPAAINMVFGTALTGLSGGVGTPSMPTQTPNPFGQALSNALGIGNLFSNIYGAIKR